MDNHIEIIKKALAQYIVEKRIPTCVFGPVVDYLRADRIVDAIKYLRDAAQPYALSSEQTKAVVELERLGYSVVPTDAVKRHIDLRSAKNVVDMLRMLFAIGTGYHIDELLNGINERRGY